MGPPGSPKGAIEVPDGTSREVPHGTSTQLQGSHRGSPRDLKASPREPQRFQGSHGELHVVPVGVHMRVSDPKSPSPELRIRASDHEELQMVSLGV